VKWLAHYNSTHRDLEIFAWPSHCSSADQRPGPRRLLISQSARQECSTNSHSIKAVAFSFMPLFISTLPASEFSCFNLHCEFDRTSPLPKRISNAFNFKMSRGTSIDNLPLELLLHVFGYVVQDPLPRVRGDMVHSPLRAMLSITQVCRRWRRLALRNSSLWAGCVDLGRPVECIEEMLRRSRKRPLHLTFFTSPTNNRKPLAPSTSTPRRPALDFIKTPSFDEVSTRTVNGSLHATLPSNSCQDAFACFQPCLPKLKTISLELEYASAVLRGHRLFKGKGWLVQSLSLTRCAIRLEPSALPFLIDLRIASLSAKDSLGVKSWLDMCAGLPQLQVLQLVDCFKRPTKAFQDTQDSKVEMPKLGKLVISTPHHDNCLRFLDALDILPSCDLTLRTTVTQKTPTYNSLLSFLSRRYSAPKKALGDDLYIAATERLFVLRTQGTSAPSPLFIQIAFQDPTVDRLRDCPDMEPHNLYHHMLKVFCNPIASVRALTLRIFLKRQLDFHPFFNPIILLKFPHVVSVELDLANIFGGPPPLDASAFPERGPSAPRMMWFTSRRELLIEHADFSEEQSAQYSLTGQYGKSVDRREDALCWTLKHHLKSERKGWKPEWDIKNVILSECHGIESSELGRMKESVGINFEVI